MIRNPNVWRRWWRQLAHLPDVALPAHTIHCPVCAQEVRIPALHQGHRAYCPRCHARLAHVEVNPLIGPIIWAATALILLLTASYTPFLGVSYFGWDVLVSLTEMMHGLLDADWGFLAIVMYLLVFATPLVFLLLTLYVFSALQWQRRWPALVGATRIMIRLRPWMMVDVFFTAAMVSLTKIGSVGTPQIGSGFWVVFVLAVCIARTVYAIPVHWTYYAIFKLENQEIAQRHIPTPISCTECLFLQEAGQTNCQVCGAALHRRKPKSLSLAMAFLVAAAILYIPANTLLMMISSKPTKTVYSTIMGGIVFLWDSHDYFIATIIFMASIVIPFLKLIGLFVLIVSAKFRPLVAPVVLSKLFHFIEWIGRWSMIDVFVTIILMALFHSPLARVTPGPAVIYFTAVIFLTMLSAYFFDIRLIWDQLTRQPALHRHDS